MGLSLFTLLLWEISKKLKINIKINFRASTIQHRLVKLFLKEKSIYLKGVFIYLNLFKTASILWGILNICSLTWYQGTDKL